MFYFRVPSTGDEKAMVRQTPPPHLRLFLAASTGLTDVAPSLPAATLPGPPVSCEPANRRQLATPTASTTAPTKWTMKKGKSLPTLTTTSHCHCLPLPLPR